MLLKLFRRIHLDPCSCFLCNAAPKLYPIVYTVSPQELNISCKLSFARHSLDPLWLGSRSLVDQRLQSVEVLPHIIQDLG
jgi:hypothetical protein